MSHYYRLGDVVVPGEHWVGLQAAQFLGVGKMVHLLKKQHFQGGC